LDHQGWLIFGWLIFDWINGAGSFFTGLPWLAHGSQRASQFTGGFTP